MDKNKTKLLVSGICLSVLLSVAFVIMTFSQSFTPSSVKENTQPPTYPSSYKINDMPVLTQFELSAGCEVYACTVALQYAGFDITETDFAQNYLIAKPISYDSKFNRYGPDMNSAYAGTVYEGYGIYAPAMQKSMNKYIKTTDSKKRAIVLKECTLEDLCHEYVVNNIPVMVWATTYMHEPYVKAEWIVNYVDENADSKIGDTEEWLQNEHCLVLMGYDDTHYYFCDSVSGEVSSYEKDISQQRFAQLGSQAIVIK